MASFWVDGGPGGPQGPYTVDRIREGLASGRWTESTLICGVGESDWQELVAVLGTDAGRDDVVEAASEEGERDAVPGNMMWRLAGEWLRYPEVLVDEVLATLRKFTAHESVDRVLTAFVWIGRVSIALAAVAGVFTLSLLAGVNDLGESRAIFALIVLLLLPSAVILQFIAVRFGEECDAASRTPPLRSSHTITFDLVGALLFGLGMLLAYPSGYLAFQGGKIHVMTAVGFAGGILVAAAGVTMFNSKALGVSIGEDSTPGQNGLVLGYCVIRAILRIARPAFGLVAAFGAIVAWQAALQFLFPGDDPGWVIIGALLKLQIGLGIVATAALTPAAAYLVSLPVFIVLDSISRLLNDSR